MPWLKHLFSRRRRYDELSESIREHLEEKIADLMDRGMTREEAERTARREFGNVALIEERSAKSGSGQLPKAFGPTCGLQCDSYRGLQHLLRLRFSFSRWGSEPIRAYSP